MIKLKLSDDLSLEYAFSITSDEIAMRLTTNDFSGFQYIDLGMLSDIIENGLQTGGHKYKVLEIFTLRGELFIHNKIIN